MAALVARSVERHPWGKFCFKGIPGRYSTYVHAQPLSTQGLNTIGIMAAMYEFYIPCRHIDRDMLLIDLIEKELPTTQTWIRPSP